MPRYRCPLYVRDRLPRYLVLWSIEWQVIECRCLGAADNFAAAMRDTIELALHEGWCAEGTAEFGFVFLRRGEQRRLLMLTPRDPRDPIRQSFSPFGA